MTDTDWITDRLPTEADADAHGEVLAQLPSRLERGNVWSRFTEWDEVPAGTPWRHTSMWPPAAPTTTIPRLFTSITHADDRYLALADDGTAWEDYGNGWVQLDPAAGAGGGGMSEDAQVIAVVAGCAIALMLVAVAPGLIADHQRYSTYLEAQRAVLQCRADHSITAIDRVCGPIPTLESIK